MKTRVLAPLLRPLLGHGPAGQLIRSTARQQWRLIAVNLVSSLVEALSEGVTLAVIFLAVEALSTPAGQAFNWAGNPIFGRLPVAAALLSGLPPVAVIASLLATAVLMQALQSFARYINLVSVGFFAARCRALVTARIHHQVLSLSFACASSYKVGDLTAYSSSGPEAIRVQIAESSALVVALLLCGTYLNVLVNISPWLLLAVIAMAAVLVLIQKLMIPRIRRGARLVTKAQVEISRRITEDFQGLRLLHSCGQLKLADRTVNQSMVKLESAMRRQERRMAVQGPFASFLPILAIALIASLSILLFKGRHTGIIPSLVTFVMALQRLNARLSSISAILNTLASNTGRIERLNQILSTKGKQFRRLGGVPFVSLKRHLRFDGVSLRYSLEQPEVLSKISFSLAKGRILALVGPSGAGKSTIADLLVGLYSPTSGRIMVDDRPLESLDLTSWQQRLGVVSQDTFLFNATIAENVSFGVEGATRQAIEAACEAAQAADFIQDLQDGYDTLVGERGYRLSGGQRQRLSLARAILKDPELLILDEATSALDSQSERVVQQAIEQFEWQRTALVIAHRLSTIVSADAIIVMDSGRIVEMGRHDELLGRGGAYARLWRYQFDGAEALSRG